MRKIVFCLFLGVLTFIVSGQTVFSYSIDTLYVSSGDSITIVGNKGNMLSVGDTVSAWFWSGSNDSIQWFPISTVTSDSVLLDTLPVYRFYCAVIQGSPAWYIVWRIDNIEYVSLRPPAVTDDAGINKSSILLVREDSIVLNALFDGLQPDAVSWYREAPLVPPRWVGDGSGCSVSAKGSYFAVGYIYNHFGDIIDAKASDAVTIDFVYPLEKIIFKSWRGSNDGKPRVIDTLWIDTCVREYIIDTLIFAIGDAYKYQFVPVIHAFDKAYNFTYKWEYSGFATVNQVDSVLEFNPIGFEHTGSYRFVTTRQLAALRWISYLAAPIRIVAFNTSNTFVDKPLITNGVVYDMFGRIVQRNVAGEYNDVINRLQIPKGVYFLRDRNFTYKFIKN